MVDNPYSDLPNRYWRLLENLSVWHFSYVLTVAEACDMGWQGTSARRTLGLS